MFRSLSPLLIGLLLGTAAFIAPALAATDDDIKEITVDMDITAVTNPAAARRFGTLADDLKGALTARLVDRISEKGRTLNVDLSEVEISNAYSEAIGSADTKLVGIVHISSDIDDTKYDTYELSVTVEQARPFFPKDMDPATLSASSNEYYKALISAFADAVVVRIED